MKGKQYDGVEDPTIPRVLYNRWVRRSARTGEDLGEVAKPDIDAFNTRWAIVGNCAICGNDLIQEELEAHRLNHVPARARSVARALAELSPEDRTEVLGIFDFETAELDLGYSRGS